MADDKDIVDEKEPAKKPIDKKQKIVAETDEKSRRSLIITIAVLGVVAVGLIITAGYFVMRSNDNAMSEHMSGFGGMYRTARSGEQPYDRPGRYVDTEITNNSVTTTVYNYKLGVVVAVNSDSIVIAGGGTRTTIGTNSSTVYTDGTKPVLDDTVAITGTTVDGTITATEITVQN